MQCMILSDLHLFQMMIYGKNLPNIICCFFFIIRKSIFYFRLRIFKLQAQIICNEMQMSNDVVQEYQVSFIENNKMKHKIIFIETFN